MMKFELSYSFLIKTEQDKIKLRESNANFLQYVGSLEQRIPKEDLPYIKFFTPCVTTFPSLASQSSASQSGIGETKF